MNKTVVCGFLAVILLGILAGIGFKSQNSQANVERGEDLGAIGYGHVYRFVTPSAQCFVYNENNGKNGGISCLPAK